MELRAYISGALVFGSWGGVTSGSGVSSESGLPIVGVRFWGGWVTCPGCSMKPSIFGERRPKMTMVTCPGDDVYHVGDDVLQMTAAPL